MLAKALCFCLCCVSIACCATAQALPPLGLTDIAPAYGPFEIIDGVGYFTATGGIRTISSTGDSGFVSIGSPPSGELTNVTRVVKGLDGELYVAANFSMNSSFEYSASLFRIKDTLSPLVTWENVSVSGIDVNLRSFGNVEGVCTGCYAASQFYLNGSIEEMKFPLGSDSTNNSTVIGMSTPQGHAIGHAGIPLTAGSGPVMWTPAGEISFLNGGFGDAASIRDRIGGGVNIGLHDWNSALIKYGDGRSYYLSNEDGETFYDEFTDLVGYSVAVSQSDFAVIKYWDYRGVSFNEIYAYYPGIVPGFPDRAVPLLDVFPELAAIDVYAIHELASVDGYLYMTLTSSDGIFLFGARDPSVIPEPAAAVMALLCGAMWFRRRFHN